MSLTVVFILCLTVSFGVIALLTRTPKKEKATRSRVQAVVISNTSAKEASTTILRETPQTGLQQKLTERFQKYRFAESLQELIQQSGSKTTLGKFILTSAGIAIAAGFLENLMIGSLPLFPIAILVGGFARYFLLKFMKKRRLKKFNEALADAIDLMARALRAGHSMASTVELVGEQSPQPLSGEFAICFQQQKFGIPFRDALLEMAERIPSKDLHFLITAILVQKETGGDLIEILERTTHVIRERVRIEGEVRTYTAQGRLTGWILSLMPVGMLGLISLITPSYSQILFHDPMGQMLLYTAGGLIVIGGLIIRKIVDIKV